MERLIYILVTVLMLNIIRPLECTDSKATTLSTLNISSTSTMDNNKNFNLTKNGYDLTNKSNVSTPTTNSSRSKEETGMVPEKCCETESSGTESSEINIFISVVEKSDSDAENATNSTIETNDAQMSMMVENLFLEPWNRVRRDDEDEGQSGSSSSSDSDQGTNAGSSESKASPGVDEETGSSDEDSSSSQAVSGETGSSEYREERDTKGATEKSHDDNTLPPYWYRGSSMDKRYLTSYENDSPRDFIKIPIFPGK